MAFNHEIKQNYSVIASKTGFDIMERMIMERNWEWKWRVKYFYPAVKLVLIGGDFHKSFNR